MNRPRRNTLLLALLGVGLLVAGLLAGVLLTLWMGEPDVAVPAGPTVERIELGRRDAAPRPARTDSGASAAGLDIRQMNQQFKDVARDVTPAVVYIQVAAHAAEEGGDNWFHNFDNRFFGDRAPRQSVGSGVVITAQGHVVTNHHVVEDAEEILVTLFDKRQYPAEVVGIDPSTDLAVIRLREAEDVPVARIGDSDVVEVGEWVLAVGNPFRLTSTVTAGIVSALGRQVNIIGDSFGIEDFIQTDAAINPGNSGGALVNLDGELVGISTAIATESGSYEGYGFAVPSNLMTRVAQDLIAYGEVQRGYLGVEIRELNARSAQRMGLRDVYGVMLSNVWQDGAAYRGGLRDGDVVLSIDGRTVTAPNELQSAIAQRRPGDRLAMEVWRDGAEQHFEVELLGRDDPVYQDWISELEQDEAAPAPELERTPPPASPHTEMFELGGWGLGLREVRDEDRGDFGVDDGAYVAYVAHGSLAHRSGLPRDVVITRIGGEPVTSPGDVAEVLGDIEGPTVLVRVQRRGAYAGFYELALPAN